MIEERRGALALAKPVRPSRAKLAAVMIGVEPLTLAKPSPLSHTMPLGEESAAAGVTERPLISTGVVPLEPMEMRPLEPPVLRALRVVCWPLLPPPTSKGETAVPRLVADNRRLGDCRLTLATPMSLALRPASRRAPKALIERVPEDTNDPKARSPLLLI